MLNKTIASFRIDITSTKKHTWQGRVICGDQIRTFESELQMLHAMIELVPGLAQDIQWPDRYSQEQQEPKKCLSRNNRRL